MTALQGMVGTSCLPPQRGNDEILLRASTSLSIASVQYLPRRYRGREHHYVMIVRGNDEAKAPSQDACDSLHSLFLHRPATARGFLIIKHGRSMAPVCSVYVLGLDRRCRRQQVALDLGSSGSKRSMWQPIAFCGHHRDIVDHLAIDKGVNPTMISVMDRTGGTFFDDLAAISEWTTLTHLPKCGLKPQFDFSLNSC